MLNYLIDRKFNRFDAIWIALSGATVPAAATDHHYIALTAAFVILGAAVSVGLEALGRVRRMER